MIEVAQQPIASCEKYYRRLQLSCQGIMDESFNSVSINTHASNHNYFIDLEKWLGTLASRPENYVLRAALREYQFALLTILQGHYRQAFMALRLFLELALSTVYFSANEFKMRMWLRGEQDIIWNTLIDAEQGVFSKNFVRAFFEELAEETAEYRSIAGKLYRECSEYVHGSAYTHDTLPDALRFDETIFRDWNEKVVNVRLVISFAFSSRYLIFLDKDALRLLESVVISELGHIPAIRNRFGITTET